MQEEIHSQKELFQKVMPALQARKSEFARLGYEVDIHDIWYFLTNEKWKFGTDLRLSDIVHDIMHVDYLEMNDYLDESKRFFE